MNHPDPSPFRHRRRPALVAWGTVSVLLLATGCGGTHHHSGAAETTTSSSPSVSASASSTSPSEAAPSSSRGTTATAGPLACAGGDPGLPDGVSKNICSADPVAQWGHAASGTAFGPESYKNTLASPTGNLTCRSLDGQGADCFRKEPAPMILGVYGENSGREVKDIMGLEAASGSTLEYGEVAISGDFACASDKVGMTCWSTRTRHGIFLSQESLRTW